MNFLIELLFKFQTHTNNDYEQWKILELHFHFSATNKKQIVIWNSGADATGNKHRAL
jgi:hypothetical protein